MIRLVQQFFVVVLTSLYYFPIGLSILPGSLNTKNTLALLGLIFLLYDCLQHKSLTISVKILGAVGFSIFFSLICLYSADVNHTTDYAYATYFVSFAVWIFGAYSVCKVMRQIHGVVNFRILTLYLTAVCFGQCVLAILIDRVPSVQILVDSYIIQGQEFLEEVDRLYGVGASLDTAGVRFSLVLLMLATLITQDDRIRLHTSKIVVLLIAFFTIFIIGNMISRTTIVGFLIAFAYIVLSTGILQFVIQQKFFKFYLTFSLVLLLGISLCVFFYQTDENFYHNMRFAFEGFFNWIEKGEWRTDSTDKLNDTMWIWPRDTKTWLIGSGLFNNFVYSTDIGYCRFILYCGLIGFSVFALFFVYNGYVFAQQNKRYALMFFFFILLSFIIWVKVATDIFVIYALFYCLDGFDSKPLTHLRLVSARPEMV